MHRWEEERQDDRAEHQAVIANFLPEFSETTFVVRNAWLIKECQVYESDEVNITSNEVHEVDEFVGRYRDEVLQTGCVEVVEKDRWKDE